MKKNNYISVARVSECTHARLSVFTILFTHNKIGVLCRVSISNFFHFVQRGSRKGHVHCDAFSRKYIYIYDGMVYH